MRVQPITYCKCIWLERWCSLFIGGGRWQSSSDRNPCYFVILSITMYNGHMVFVKIWSHIFIYSKWSNLQLGDDTERDIIFFSFSGTTQKTHGISWLQIQIKVWSWLLGDSSSFWDQPSPLEVFLDVAVAQYDLNKWSPQCSDRPSLPWNIHAFSHNL